jgi:biotin transporter BioY
VPTPPDEKHLRTTSFVAHATRGVIRDQNTRRKAMMLLLAGALLLLISGFTFLQSALNPREHPWRVIFFWIACIWLTFTALLLALFDLLVLRSQARRAERELREKLEAARLRQNASPARTSGGADQDRH